MPWDKARPRSKDYGSAHAKARKAAAARHDPADPCSRCRLPLGPMGAWLHLDHTDDRSAYLGFSHRSCNESAAARKANARRKQARGTPAVAHRYVW